MISLLDTNVIIRFLTADENPKYKTLYSFFQSLEQGQMRLELKLIVLFQVIFVLKSFYRVPKKRIVDGMKNILKYRGIHTNFHIRTNNCILTNIILLADLRPRLIYRQQIILDKY